MEEAYILFEGKEAGTLEAVHALNAASRFLSGYSINKTESRNNKNITPVKIAALQSDAYMAASDFESAEEIRHALLDEKKNLENLSDEDESLMQILFVNSAVYALNYGNDEQASSYSNTPFAAGTCRCTWTSGCTERFKYYK